MGKQFLHVPHARKQELPIAMNEKDCQRIMPELVTACTFDFEIKTNLG